LVLRAISAGAYIPNTGRLQLSLLLTDTLRGADGTCRPHRACPSTPTQLDGLRDSWCGPPFGEQQVPQCVRRPTAVQICPADAGTLPCTVGVREGRLAPASRSAPVAGAPVHADVAAAATSRAPGGASEHRVLGSGARYVSGCTARNAGRLEVPAAARSDRTRTVSGRTVARPARMRRMHSTPRENASPVI
jgi:hypothetical protein